METAATVNLVGVATRIGRGYKKASDAQLVDAYGKGASVWQVAARFGMCGQAVHERLERLGLTRHIRVFTEAEVERLRAMYATGVSRGDGKLAALAAALGRTKPYLCRQAKKLGLTDNGRGLTPELAQRTGERTKTRWALHDHPRGMLGKKHTQKTKDRLSKANTGRPMPSASVMKSLKTKAAKYGRAAHNGLASRSWKAGWRVIGGARIYARSRWEANYARYLEHLRSLGKIEKWEHEPETFWFEPVESGCRSFLPDFRVTEIGGHVAYHEVKGWMDERSRTTIRRMAEFHPSVTLHVLDAVWYRGHAKELSMTVPGWEFGLQNGRLTKA